MNAMLVDVGGVVEMASTALVAVPAQDPPPPPGRGEEFGKASPVALVVILLMALATAVLIRSMTVRIKRLPQSFDQPGSSDDGAGSPDYDRSPDYDPTPDYDTDRPMSGDRDAGRPASSGDRGAEDAGGPRG